MRINHKHRLSLKTKIILCFLRVFHQLTKRTLWSYAVKMKQRFIKPRIKPGIKLDTINNISLIRFNSDGDSKHRIFYFHGGGFLLKGRRNHYRVIHKLAKLSGFEIIYIDYPLVPDDLAFDVIQKTKEVITTLIAEDQTKMNHLMGDSAGGNLALVLANKISSVQSTILISPWLDLSMQNPDILPLEKDETMFTAEELRLMGERYAGNLSVKDPLVSPIFQTSLSTPTLMIAGEKDILFPDMETFHRKHQEIQFHIYSDLPHDFVFITNTKETIHALKTIKTFINNLS